jgi:hypothetical protein
MIPLAASIHEHSRDAETSFVLAPWPKEEVASISVVL